MKRATALLKNGNIFVQGYSKTTTGMWIATGPVHISRYGQAAEMAEGIRAAFESSTQGVPHPTREEWPLVQKPMLDAVGARNWTQLARGAKAVGLGLEDGVVTLSPSANYGSHDNADEPAEIEVDFSSDQLGERMIEAFEACI